MNHAIDGVGIDIERIDLECVGMHKERVTLREVDGHGTIGKQGVARLLMILTVFARQPVLMDGVCIDDMTESFAQSGLRVIVDTVADKLFP